MLYVFTWVMARIRREEGQDLVEYGMLGGLIALAIVGAILIFEGALTSLSQGISDCIDFDGGTTCSPGL